MKKETHLSKKEFELLLVEKYTSAGDKLEKRIHRETTRGSDDDQPIPLTLYYKNGVHHATWQKGHSVIFDSKHNVIYSADK